MLASFCKGLSQIGDVLPRIELSLTLYPSPRMKNAIAHLYAYLIKYFIMAKDFYEEGKILHVLHSITRPFELRCKDLVSDIDRCSKNVTNLAVSGAQAEQRAMHLAMQGLVARQATSDAVLLEMKELIISTSHPQK